MIQLNDINMDFDIKQINERQRVILSFFDFNIELSISDVFEKIQKDFSGVSKLTIGRDLKRLVECNFLARKGAGRSVVYTLSPKYVLVRTIDTEKYFTKTQDERVIQTQFNFNIFETLKSGVFTKAEKEKLEVLHNKFQTKFESIKSDTLTSKEFERIMIEFSWKSSQIEGNTYSLLDTELLIKENKKAEGKTEAETSMILNHKEIFEYVLNNRQDFTVLTLAKLEHIHSVLTKGLGIPRNLRKAPVGITGTNYKPLDNVFQIEEAVEKMIDLVNNKNDFFEKSFLCLVLLSYIQPFEDGNKRTARMASNAILLAHNTTPISYRAVNEVEYKKASLLFYEINNLSYFKEVFLKQYEFAVENYF